MAVQYLAANRFGLGRRFDDPAIGDPKAWLNRQLGDYDPAPAALAGLAGTVATARAVTGQAGMGIAYELDAIAAAVIGGTSLMGGVGRIAGTVIGVLILGVMTSGFTFLGIDAYYQEIVKGMIIVIAVVTDQMRQKKRSKA